ncbi:MAG: hypothetical protein RL031_489 [Actinomycetota bacterium]|jgi:hypothetical protein
MKRSSFVATLATFALSISAILVGVTSANASITLPKGAFLPCSAGGGAYCIESVSVTPSGGKAIALTWVATGSQGSAAGNTNGVAAGKDLPGRWSADGAFTNENYDGLYVEAQAANEFVPWIVLDAKPTYSPGNKVSLAATATSATTPVNLNSDAVISVKMRISDFKLGVTYGIATEATVDVQSGVFEIAGYPVKVPQAKNTKDCSGDAGVSSALVTQFQSILVPSNDPLGFSFEGGSGKIYVGSNGLCKLSTPVWNSEKKSLSYKASAPRLSPDGKTVNTGFYYATISSADALALWGLTRPEDAASALLISVRTNEGGSTAATKTVAVKNGRIIIQVFGFEFPDPMLDISLNPSYDVLASSAQNASNMSASGTVRTTASPKPKTTTISCIKGNQLRKVTGVKPKCPTGFKKRS